jgi:hypothetical protein
MEPRHDDIGQFVENGLIDAIDRVRFEAGEPAEPDQLATGVLNSTVLLQQQIAPQPAMLQRHRAHPLLVTAETDPVNLADPIGDKRLTPFRKVTTRNTQI